MKVYVGLTDYHWFQYLKNLNPNEVNFWQPGSGRRFKAIQPGELFLFKLHVPNNYIVGGGIFIRQAFLPTSLTWDTFGKENGTSSLDDFIDAIYQYRRTNSHSDPDPVIGSLILSEPFFFDENEWIPVPQNWSPNIVQGKTYTTDSIEGKILFDAVQSRIALKSGIQEEKERYGAPQLIKPRLGQGGFRVAVTEAYHRRCAISGERTLPVLNASHIKPYSKEGPHVVSNGLLLREDIHTLFDRGYITIDEDDIVEVSGKIKEIYDNGKVYYAFHGKRLMNIPDAISDRPSHEFLQWHNEHVYIG
ncbi:HNH endonuclease [Sporolactobacillus pectinivorans]|uniref:HNH endonuclease n=1 Tax=Sporolactobacillus pectinivorans TaxID=1591408 RepID=UPI000C269523|nr:HNH endonuclease [Sporolactobacillus pectinivorans]